MPAEQRTLGVNPELATHAAQWFQAGRQLRLDLLENQDVTVHLTDVRRAEDGAVELQGILANLSEGSAHLVLAGGELSGLAQVPGLGVFQWVPDGAGTSVVTRLPSGRSRWCATPDGPPLSASEATPYPGSGVVRHSLEEGVWDPSTEPTVIDVMVVYTPRVLAAQGDEASLRRGIQTMLENANRAYTNSLIGVRLNLVFAGLHGTWAESGNMLTELNAMPGDARLEAWRNDYKADLVYLIIESDSNGYSGAAALLSDPRGNPDYCRSVMRRNVLIGNPRWAEFESLSLTHETAHMLGAGHDREHGYPSAFQGTKAAFTYSNGYRFEAGGVTYRDAMSYDPGVQLSLFSNPNLTFDGVVLGVPAGQAGEADNAQTLNRIAPQVAGYRVSRSRIGFAVSDVSVGEGEGLVTVRLERNGDLNSSTRVAVGFDTTSPAKPGLDYTRPASVLVAFATNQATAEIVVPILQDELVEGDETLRLTLASVLGSHGLAIPSACHLTIRDDEASFVADPGSLILPENGEAATVAVNFTGPLAEGAAQEVRLVVGMDGDTATPGADFEVTPATLTFTAANRRQSFHVRVVPGDGPEADETARLAIGNSIVLLRILDDERAGSLARVAAPNGTVISVTALPTGGAMVTGDFTQVGEFARTGVARLRSDGSVDPDFTPPDFANSRTRTAGVPPAKILCATRLTNGDWMLGGIIGLADGAPVQNLVRLKSDGRLDTTFVHPGFDGMVWTVREAADGRLLVGGTFDQVGSRRLRALVRLNPDGSLDPTFKLEPGLEGVVVAGSAIGVLPDGRLLVGGMIEKYNGTAARNLVRLHSDGSLDPSFPLLKSGASTPIICVAVLPDGRAYLGGFFETIGGRAYKRLVRLNADGGVDPTFRAPQPNGEILDLLPLPNGQLLVAGGFTVIAGANRRYVALLNEDGTLDHSFDLGRGAVDQVWAVAAGGDGSLFVGGALRSFNDQAAPYLARLRLPSIRGAFTLAERASDGSFKARVLGLPGAGYAVESTSDFLDWQPAGEVRLDGPGNSAEFAAPTGAGARFFRIRSP
jgi:uncharacterized delta-60 repeat protein